MSGGVRVVLAMFLTLAVLLIGFALGYHFGKAAGDEAQFMRGYCAGLDIEDTSCREYD